MKLIQSRALGSGPSLVDFESEMSYFLLAQFPRLRSMTNRTHTRRQRVTRERKTNGVQLLHEPNQHLSDFPKELEEEEHLDLSVVVPLLNEGESLAELSAALRQVLEGMKLKYEMIFVDDGSTDNSFRILQEMHELHGQVKAIRFRKNFGKSAALSAGFQAARGEIVVTMDADLQDDPEEIPPLVEKLGEGYDLVSGWKKKRYDPLSKTIPSRFFNFVTAKLTGIRLHDFNCGLKVYRAELAKGLNIYGELHRYVPVLAHWAGFQVGEIAVRHHPRKYGKTKFGLGRFWKGFLDLLTVLFTTRYIQRPLHLFGVWGLVSFLVGLVIDVYLSIEWLLGRTAISNRPLFLLGIALIIVGVQFVSFGLLGEMITKTQQPSREYAIREVLQ
jgi:glycosyltransferase involved in cell wall biosynthesis